jgi:N-carbamoyl-L-amino-acid hydrolase
VFTVGELSTDPDYHGPSTVSGETRFVLDFRSTEESVLSQMTGFAAGLAWDLGQERGVRFELGPISESPPAHCDARIRGRLCERARTLGLPDFEMASGAGHDAAAFAKFGVPAGMIFIRNEHSSHNPDEAMDMADFAKATRLLTAYLIEETESPGSR